MIRTAITAAAAFAAMAVPAFASEVRINLNGKDDAAIQAEIVAAATKVCRETEFVDYLGRTRAMCVSSTVKETQAKVAAIMSGSSLPKNTLASR